MRVEVARQRVAPATAPETGGDETAVLARALERNERPRTALEDEHPRVHARRRVERPPREPPRDGDLVPGAPHDSVDAARPGQAALDRRPPFDDEVGAHEGHAGVVEQAAQDLIRSLEGPVRDGPERLAR